MCTPKDRAKCTAEIDDEEHLEWTCKNCPKKKPEDLHPYTHKLLRLRRLKLAGYPFGANDLTMEEWFDLGKMEEMMGIGK